MRRKLAIGSVVLALLALSTGVLWAGLSGSKHDFSGASWSGNTICDPCHTPHNAITTVTTAPLWNHTLSSATYNLYVGTAMDSTPVQPNPASGSISALCLSCHDGTVGLDQFGGASATTYISGTANLGTDLSGDHPIAITYNTATATNDGELFDPATSASGLGGTISQDMLFGGSNDQLECASCHDAHNSANIAKMLRISNTNSALCTTCHNK